MVVARKITPLSSQNEVIGWLALLTVCRTGDAVRAVLAITGEHGGLAMELNREAIRPLLIQC